MAHTSLLLVLPLLLWFVSRITSAETYYATPTCPEGSVSCMSLSQYATQPNDYFASNTTLILLPWNHSLDSELAITAGTYLTISAPFPGTTVTCCQSARFRFENIHHISISGVTFVGCANNAITSVEHFLINDCNFDGQLLQSHEGNVLKLESLSNAIILNSSFFNIDVVVHDSAWNKSGAITVYNSKVYMFQCKVANNAVWGFEFQIGSIVLVLRSTIATGDCTFCNNAAEHGVVVYTEDSDVSINSSEFINNIGGTVYVVYSNTTVYITNSIFINCGYIGGAVNFRNGDVAIYNCTFINNTAILSGAVNFLGSHNHLIIDSSAFRNNTAYGDHHSGGAVDVADSNVVSIVNSIFANNGVLYYNGGAVSVKGSDLAIRNSTFTDNFIIRQGVGGAVYFDGNCNHLTIDESTFIKNRASYLRNGGAVFVLSSFNLAISNCTFISNTAALGGALCVFGIPIMRGTINISTFSNNTADYLGGAMYISGAVIDNDNGSQSLQPNLMLIDTSFNYNMALKGATIYAVNFAVSSTGYLEIVNNAAHYGNVYVVQSSIFLLGIITVSNNTGSVFVLNSNVTLSGNTTFIYNLHPNVSQSVIQEGGAITTFQSNLYFLDTVNMLYNQAENGGAILATESKIYMNGYILIAHNSALQSGGGIYVYQTEIKTQNRVVIQENVGTKNGGGMYAISSTIKVVSSHLHFIDNNAEKGGGVCLEQNAKLYVIKNACESYYSEYLSSCTINKPSIWPRIIFTDNSAVYGGAVYVTDDKNSGTCSATPSTVQSVISECFFQVITSYLLTDYGFSTEKLNFINFNFTNNTATVAGGTIFGGLLDRCRLSPFAEVLHAYHLFPNQSVTVGTPYLLNVTNLEKSDLTYSKISSYPVNVCFCKNDQPDCSNFYQPLTKHILKGHSFTVSVVAIDQVNNIVPNSFIHSSLSSGHGRLNEGQAIQFTNESQCTELQYNAFSPHDNETLQLYAEGPCNDTGISAHYIDIAFLDCPIGFKASLNPTEGECLCDPSLSPYITNCFIGNQTVLRAGNFWITYVNDSSNVDNNFIVKPYCPFDYCHPHTDKVYINFTVANGADAQCAFNRTGILCGSCRENLSLSFGSSLCSPCSNYWLSLLILFAIAGIVLVAFLLILNLTVAVGTINGLIFYANIIAAYHAIFLPFDKANFLTVFIAWLNLDFGFVTCFYHGMDGYAKVWLQLVFPCYIILLVISVIFLCEYSHRFSKLLSHTNPVATLATLILLSYAKLLRVIIAALSFTILEYPDNSHKTVWLFDSNIPYLEKKHIGLFAAALLVLLAGLIYMLLLIFWQLILRFIKEHHVEWMGNNHATLYRWYIGLGNFMDAYHAPYNRNHRYWTGLLLLLRSVLYLISAVNVFGDPSINLLSTIGVVVLLLIFVHRIYKEEYLNNLDTLFLANLGMFAAGTLYLRAAGSGNQAALAYTSTSIVFIASLGIICNHIKVYLYTSMKQRIQQQHNYNNLKKKTEKNETAEENPMELIPLLPANSESEIIIDGLPSTESDNDSQDPK